MLALLPILSLCDVCKNLIVADAIRKCTLMTVRDAADCCRAKLGHMLAAAGLQSMILQASSLTTLHPFQLKPLLNKLDEHVKSAIEHSSLEALVPQREMSL